MKLPGACRIFKQEFRVDFYRDNIQSESFSAYKGTKFLGFVVDNKKGFYLALFLTTFSPIN